MWAFCLVDASLCGSRRTFPSRHSVWGLALSAVLRQYFKKFVVELGALATTVKSHTEIRQ